MARKVDFSAAEWDTLSEAPLAASLLITLASPSLFGAMGEIFGATRRLVEEAQQPTTNELLGDLRAEFKQMETARNAQPDLEGRNVDEIKASLNSTLREAANLLATRVPADEADEVRRWIHTVATATAEASKEGGFLGFGGVRVSEEETAALEAIAQTLGIRA